MTAFVPRKQSRDESHERKRRGTQHPSLRQLPFATPRIDPVCQCGAGCLQCRSGLLGATTQMWAQHRAKRRRRTPSRRKSEHRLHPEQRRQQQRRSRMRTPSNPKEPRLARRQESQASARSQRWRTEQLSEVNCAPWRSVDRSVLEAKSLSIRCAIYPRRHKRSSVLPDVLLVSKRQLKIACPASCQKVPRNVVGKPSGLDPERSRLIDISHARSFSRGCVTPARRAPRCGPSSYGHT